MPLTEQQIDIYRRMPAWKKLAIAADFNRAARELKRASFRALRPEWSEEQLDREVRKAFLYASD